MSIDSKNIPGIAALAALTLGADSSSLEAARILYGRQRRPDPPRPQLPEEVRSAAEQDIIYAARLKTERRRLKMMKRRPV